MGYLPFPKNPYDVSGGKHSQLGGGWSRSYNKNAYKVLSMHTQKRLLQVVLLTFVLAQNMLQELVYKKNFWLLLWPARLEKTADKTRPCSGVGVDIGESQDPFDKPSRHLIINDTDTTRP